MNKIQTKTSIFLKAKKQHSSKGWITSCMSRVFLRRFSIIQLEMSKCRYTHRRRVQEEDFCIYFKDSQRIWGQHSWGCSGLKRYFLLQAGGAMVTSWCVCGWICMDICHVASARLSESNWIQLSPSSCQKEFVFKYNASGCQLVCAVPICESLHADIQHCKIVYL